MSNVYDFNSKVAVVVKTIFGLKTFQMTFFLTTNKNGLTFFEIECLIVEKLSIALFSKTKS